MTKSNTATDPQQRPTGSSELAAERVLVLDFGSQFAQLIARRVREQHVYCEIVRHDLPAERIAEIAPKGIILSGGPSSVYADDAPRCDRRAAWNSFGLEKEDRVGAIAVSVDLEVRHLKDERRPGD